MTSRAAVRRDVATNLLDIRALEATSDGDTQGLIDAVRLTQDTGWYVGCDLVCVGTANANGLNIGRQAYVTGSSKAISALTFQPPMPQPTRTGDRFELYNLNRIGGELSDYELWINAAVNSSAEQKIWSRIEKGVGTWSCLTGGEGIAIPREIRRFHSLRYVDSEGITRYPDRGSPHSREGWWADPVHRIVRIAGDFRTTLDGLEATLVGFGAPPPLLEDAAESDIPHAYLVAAASVIAAQALSRKGRADVAQGLGMWMRDKDREMRTLGPGAPPTGSIRIW